MYHVQMPDGSLMDVQDRSVKAGKPTKAALKHWKAHHGAFVFGYVDLSGLSAEDVLSVISAAQQGIIRLGYDAEHRVNSYKLLQAAWQGIGAAIGSRGKKMFDSERVQSLVQNDLWGVYDGDHENVLAYGY